MADEILSPSRRDRLLRRRSWRKRGALASVAVVALGVGITGALLVADDGGSETGTTTTPPTTDPSATSAPSPAITGVVGEIDQLPKGRALSHDDPLRLWIGGDSLSGAIGPVIGQYSEDSGVVDALVDFKVSSGLATQVRDWPEYAADLISEEDPEAIVFMVGANDAIVVDSSGEWEDDYRRRVQEMMDLLVGGDAHRTVFWIGSPPMRLAEREEGILELNRVYEEEALLRPDVIYVDAYTMLEGPDGGYSSSIYIEGQGTLYVRSGDGVHFTTAGAEWVGYNVWRLIDRRWDVGRYQQPDLPIDFRTEPGGNTGCCDEPDDGSSGNGGTPTTSATTTTIDCSVETCETTTSTGETTTTVPSESTTTAPPTTATPTTAPPTSGPPPT